ncbi:uncharacterized protein [Antedon mediterranea]|uniref:uncharacterized protein n=1 Tax=Antedon mediterranea TaxID=105859 RepID=UPI003AF83F6C
MELSEKTIQHFSSISEKNTLSPTEKDVMIFLKEQQEDSYRYINLMEAAVFGEQYKVDIADVFTDLELLQSTKQRHVDHATRMQESKRTHLKDVLKVIKSKRSCKVLITGKGGMGKTTLLRYIAYNWASNKDDTFSDKILFLINIRDLQAGKTIIDTIVDQVNLQVFSSFMNTKSPKELIQQFLIKQGDKLVVLLDGLDEIKQGVEVPISLFISRNFKTTTLITSRPENITKFVEACDVHIEVNGFSKESQRQYIGKYFVNNEDPNKGKMLCSELTHNSHKENSIVELCSSPLLLLMICSIWEEFGKLSKHLSDLFKELICCTLNQFILKENRAVDKPRIENVERIPVEYKKAILALGQCIYEGLKTNKLIIDKYKFTCMVEKRPIVDLALRIGFVYKKQPVSKRDRKEIFAPPHKLLSDALAGFYLADKCQSGDLNEEECEMIMFNDYLHTTIVFTIGFLGADAGRFMKHWLKVKASNYYSLAKYFRYVKAEHRNSVLKELDKEISRDKILRETCSEMTESFRSVLRIGSVGKLKATLKKTDEHLVQLMSKYLKYVDDQSNCYDRIENTLSMIMTTRATKSTADFCAMLVHIYIIVHGLMRDRHMLCRYGNEKRIFELHSLVDDSALDTLSAVMENFQFHYSFHNVTVAKSVTPKF